MYKLEYFKIINNINLAYKTKEEINSVNDFVVIGKLEIDNTENFTYFNLTFRNEYTKEMCEGIVKDRFRYDEIPKGFMVINEIGIRSREFDNVKYFNIAGDLLFSNTWCE